MAKNTINTPKIINKNIDDLIFAEYNPRQLTKDQYRNLSDSIIRFGLVDPILINKNKKRKNIIIGGHQRVRIAKKLNIKEIPCVELDLPYEREKELNIRLNKNTGEWNFDILADLFDLDELIEYGFKEQDLIGKIKDEVVDPEIEISPELFEAHNYVVLYFDNELDWQTAKEVFDLKIVKNKDDGMIQKGLGRIIEGKKVLKKML